MISSHHRNGVTSQRPHRYSYGSGGTSSGSDRHDVITNSDLDRLRHHVAFSDTSDSDTSTSGEEQLAEEDLSPQRRRRVNNVPRVPSYHRNTKHTDDNNTSYNANLTSRRIGLNTAEPLSSNVHKSTVLNTHKVVDKKKAKKKSEHGFLRDVQHELEGQRSNWSYEVDRLLTRDDSPGDNGSTGHNGMTSAARGGHSYIDTSSGHEAVFTAFVDVREYPARCVDVHVDTLTNQLIIKAEEATPLGAVTKTFTQKLTLPRFSDDRRLESKMNNKGLLRIRVPLLYYFAQKHLSDSGKKANNNNNRGQINTKDAKSFVYQVNRGRDGKERLELLVNTGTSYSARDLEVSIDEHNRLLVHANNGIKIRLLKQYTLPDCADVDNVTSRLTRDGRLQVNIPLDRQTQTPLSR